MSVYASIGMVVVLLAAALLLRRGRRGGSTVDAPVRWRPPDDRGAAPISRLPVSRLAASPSPISPVPVAAAPEPVRRDLTSGPMAVEPPGPPVETATARVRRPGVNNCRFGRGVGVPARAASGWVAGTR